MSAQTSIEWTDVTWNPVRGCSLVSAGCTNCYAMKQAHRFSGAGQPYSGLTELGPNGPRWTGKIQLVEDALDAPLHWKKPRRIFVNSMSDLFHEGVPDEFIHQVFAVMSQTSRHTYQILTKRPERMRKLMADLDGEFFWALVEGNAQRMYGDLHPEVDRESISMNLAVHGPLPNVWLGVSIEDQQTADERIPILIQTPAAVRWVSAEPLLGPVDLTSVTYRGGEGVGYVHNVLGFRNSESDGTLNWVVVGGESGPGARPCDIGHIRHIVTQCRDAGVPVFVKQLGSNVYSRNRPMSGQDCIASTRNQFAELTHRKGADMAEWPEDLRVREWPR